MVVEAAEGAALRIPTMVMAVVCTPVALVTFGLLMWTLALL